LALLTFWLLAVWTTLELFVVFDWNHGLARLALLAVVAGLLWCFGEWAGRFATLAPSGSATRRVINLLIVGALANAGVAAYFIDNTYRTGDVRSDQAHTVLDASRLLRQGLNPYSTAAVTDRAAHDLAVAALDARAGCRASAGTPTFRAGRAESDVVPQIVNSPECESIRRLFSSLGFKYGPVTLAFYTWFLIIFGPAGIISAHVLLIVAMVFILLSWGRDVSGSTFWPAFALLPLLWPTHLAWNTLRFEHLDLPAVFLAIVGWRLYDRRKYGLAGASLGLSFAAKFLPAAVFLPLLSTAPRRAWIIAVAVIVAAFLPFAVWDATGLWHNVGYPFTRPPDSTAAAFFLPATVWTLVKAASLLVAGVLAWRGHRALWDRQSTVEYLCGAVLLVLASGATFHNNYLVWLPPVLGVFVVSNVSEHQ